MQEKELYERPECESIDLQIEGYICDNKSGKPGEGTNWGGGY